MRAYKYPSESLERYLHLHQWNFLEIPFGLGSKAKIYQNTQICSAQKFQLSGWLENFITPKLFILSGIKITVGKRRKYSINLVFSSWSDSSHISTRIEFFWLLVTVKSDLTSVPTFLFWSFLGGFEKAHLSWYFHGMMWCLSYICDCSFHKMSLI
jgi:hypothetical protein